MENRKLLITSMLLVGLIAVGGTLAWFTDMGEVINTFETGNVAVTLHDILDGDEYPDGKDISNVMPGNEYDKEIYVSSQGSIDTFVRVKLEYNWYSDPKGAADIYLPVENVDLKIDDENWKQVDGWWYYKHPLKNGEESSKLVNGIAFDKELTNNDYKNAAFIIEAKAEAVQATNGAAQDIWGVDPGNLGD